jgi:hypothetical protein
MATEETSDMTRVGDIEVTIIEARNLMKKGAFGKE